MQLTATLQDGLRRDPLTAVTIGIIGFICIVAIVGPFLASHDPLATDPSIALKPPSWQHPCGTDHVGRDICTRIVYATRLDLFVAMSAVALALVVGSVIGSISGFFGGLIDRLAMWMIDTIMAFPLFLLAMGIVAALGNSLENII